MAKVALAGIGVVLAIALLAIALGGGSSPDERKLVKASTIADDGSPQLACNAAVFALGKQDGTIDFTLRCDGIGVKGTNRVVTSRFSDSRPGARSDFLGVSQSSPKSGTSSARNQGGCLLRRGTVSCTTRWGKPVELKAKLWVPPGSECTRAISAYVVLPSRCGNSACNLEFATESLFRGPPRGCV
jgi:hypothetical protein